jgi:hypothetical protein
MSPLFDAYIIVDWSAASRPVTGTNSIWIGTLYRDATDTRSYLADNPSTRRDARDRLLATATDLVARGARVLIGCDFAMGYPTGTADALGLDTQTMPPWQAMQAHLSTHIHDAPDNANDRFQVAATLNAKMTGTAHPFWGAPPAQTAATLSTRKGDFSVPDSLAEHRLAEAWIKTQFKAHPKSVWQLLGAGAVGSQSLLGLPLVSHLRAHLPGARIWPFETGLANLTPDHLKDTPCVIAEVYPSTVGVTPKAGEILDQAQVRILSNHLESLDSAGKLGAAFNAPDSTSDGEKHRIIHEEGWILAK